MLIKMECTQCGAQLNVDESKEHFFCIYCGNKIINLPRERITTSQTVHVVQRMGNDAVNAIPGNNMRNLVISYDTVDSSIGLQVNINETGQTIYVSEGQSQSLSLPIGEYHLQILFGRRGYSRVLKMPENDVAMQIDCYHGSPNKINIFSIPIGKYLALTGKAVDFGSDFEVKPKTGYLQLVRRLEGLGFTNIAAFPLKDLGRRHRNQNGWVESITIGDKEFEVDDWGVDLEGYFPFDVDITIDFHSMENGNDKPYFVQKRSPVKKNEPIMGYTNTPANSVITEYTTTINETRDIYEYGGVRSSTSTQTVVQPMRPETLSGNNSSLQQGNVKPVQQGIYVAPQSNNQTSSVQTTPQQNQGNNSFLGFFTDAFNEVVTEMKNVFVPTAVADSASASAPRTTRLLPPSPMVPSPTPIVTNSNPSAVAASAVPQATVTQNVSSGRPIADYKKMPEILNRACKGQKIILGGISEIHNIKVCFGWNYNDYCDVNVSTFFLNNNKVIDKGWFMCNERLQSPDNCVYTIMNDPTDRKVLCINLDTLNPQIEKIAFAITIDKAIGGNSFGLLRDTYMRITDDSNRELAGFVVDECRKDISTMIIGEVYKMNSFWKFNAAGNGMLRDIMGLREFYGAL